MTLMDTEHFALMSKAIDFMHHHSQENVNLDQLAAFLGYSPSYVQRLFTQWVGLSPKQFQQYLRVEHIKTILHEHPISLLKVSEQAGVSSTSRVHDLFVKIEAMTPKTYQQAGENLTVSYHFGLTPFGTILLASTPKGLCYAQFVGVEDDAQALAIQRLAVRFANAVLIEKFESIHKDALSVLAGALQQPIKPIGLYLAGSPFQIKVWEALLTIPEGQLVTYSSVAAQIGQPRAQRAVGTAIASNPIAYLIPCHRVIRATGQIGGYRWSPERKRAMIAWEQARKA